jgi:hypothetical protein
LPQAVIVSREVKKSDGTMMKTGGRFKDNTAGKIYIIRSETDSGTLFLEGENGLGTLSLVNRQFSLPIDFNSL